MAFKPNYRLDRAERTRSKEAKKQEKRNAQAARRENDQNPDIAFEEIYGPHPIEQQEDHDGTECPIEE